MDKRRIFSASQKREIYFRANGLCESCGCDLEEEDWHAHHIERYADGGLTDTLNGMALCVPCHKEEHRNDKPIREESMKAIKKKQVRITLRKPQEKARRALVETIEKYMLIVMGAGVGKSILAGIYTQELKDRGEIDIAVVLVPQNNTKSSYRKDWALIGERVEDFDDVVSSAMRPPRQSHVIGTYQMMPRIMEYVERWAKKGARILVIFDEVHHLMDDTGMMEQNTWGENSEKIASASSRTLCLSATPFRHDKGKIKFLKYDDDGYAKPLYSYGLAEGIADGVNKDIRFRLMDKDFEGSWVDETMDLKTGLVKRTEKSVLLSDATEREELQIKKAMFQPGSPLPKRMMRESCDKLMEIRAKTNGRKREKLIAFCRNIDEMNRFAKEFEEETGVRPVVVHSNCKDPQGIIDRFRDSDDLVLFCVDMVSEGCNIPSLCVALILKHMTSRAQHYQTVTRCCRIIKKGDNETAYIFTPAFKSHRDLAMEMMTDIMEQIEIKEERRQTELTESEIKKFTKIEGHKESRKDFDVHNGRMVIHSSDREKQMSDLIRKLRRMEEEGAHYTEIAEVGQKVFATMMTPETVEHPSFSEEEEERDAMELSNILNEEIGKRISTVIFDNGKQDDKASYARARKFIYEVFSDAIGQEVKSISNIRGDCTPGQIKALFGLTHKIEDLSYRWLKV